jgi:DNA-binding transcriptional ArsR family regulator
MVTSIDIGGLPADRIRVAPSPLAELAAVLHLLAEPQHHPDLASAAASMASAIGAPLAAELDEFGLLWPPAGADFLLPPDPRPTLRAELDDIDRLDDETWVSAALAAHRSVTQQPAMWSPLSDPVARERALASARARGPRQAAWAARVLGDPASERDRVRRVLLDCESAFFGATWERVRPALAEEAERRRIDLGRDGIRALERISRAIRVDPERGVLTLDKLQDLTADARAGITLIPSVFGGPHLTLVYTAGWQPVLQYPRPGREQRPVLRVDELDARLAALAHPVRLRLCRTLARGPHTTGELAELWALTPPEVSRHLAVLKAAGLLLAQRHGRYVTYRLELDACAGLGLQLVDVIRR